MLAALPEAARIDDFVGAVTFTEFFIRESQEVLRTNDSTLFETLIADDCGFCASVLQQRDELLDEGNVMSGGGVSFDTAYASQGLQSDGTWVIDIPLEVARTEFVDSAGDPVNSIDPEEFVGRLHMEWLGNTWRVLEFAQAH